MSFLQSDALLQYLYREMPVAEQHAFFGAMDSDTALRTEMDALQDGIRILSSIRFSPAQHAVDSILAYAHS